VGAACGGDDDDDGTAGDTFVSDIRPAIEAVEAELGAGQEFFEVTANEQVVNLFVAVDDATAAVPYVYLDGELQPPAPTLTGASGFTFTADAVDFDEDSILDAVSEELPESTIERVQHRGRRGWRRPLRRAHALRRRRRARGHPRPRRCRPRRRPALNRPAMSEAPHLVGSLIAGCGWGERPRRSGRGSGGSRLGMTPGWYRVRRHVHVGSVQEAIVVDEQEVVVDEQQRDRKERDRQANGEGVGNRPRPHAPGGFGLAP
jgi:hypothetical protein